MKKISILLTLIAVVIACFGISVTALADGGDGYVYYAQDVDGVFTAYSVTPLSDNKDDISLTKAENLSVNTVYAFNAGYKNDAKGRVYVQIKYEGDGADLRAVKVNGNNVENIDASFADNMVSFYIDQAGTYAVIDVKNAVKGGFAWYHILLIVGVVAAISMCVISLIRRKK